VQENVCYLHLRVNIHAANGRVAVAMVVALRAGGWCDRRFLANKGASEWMIDQASQETRCCVDVRAEEVTRNGESG
jgi:hypothetical protein